MKLAAALALITVVLAGCQSSNQALLVAPEARVFIPDNRFFVCPTVSDFPNPETLTDGEIAELLVRLDTNNRVCRDSIVEIRRQLLAAQARLEQS